MFRYLTMLTQIKRDEKGVTALEYGLIAALISIVIIGSVTTLGGNLKTTFANIATAMTAASTTNASTSK